MNDSIVHVFHSLKYSLDGLSRCFRDEIAFRQECLLAVPHFVAVFMLPLEWHVRLFLTALWFILVGVELMNTAVEAVTDIASPGKHDLAKKAKDVASAAVFLMIVLLCVSWAVVLVMLYLR